MNIIKEIWACLTVGTVGYHFCCNEIHILFSKRKKRDVTAWVQSTTPFISFRAHFDFLAKTVKGNGFRKEFNWPILKWRSSHKTSSNLVINRQFMLQYGVKMNSAYNWGCTIQLRDVHAVRATVFIWFYKSLQNTPSFRLKSFQDIYIEVVYIYSNSIYSHIYDTSTRPPTALLLWLTGYLIYNRDKYTRIEFVRTL